MPVRTDVTIRERSPYSLVYSTTADRANPLPLDGANVSGSIYVFVTPTTNVTSVRFYKDLSQASTLDSSSPFDLEGNAGASANPLDTSAYSGDTIFYALVTLANGTVYSIQAAFNAGPVLASSSITPDQPVATVAFTDPTILISGGAQTVAPITITGTAAVSTAAVGTGSASAIAGDSATIEPALASSSSVFWCANFDGSDPYFAIKQGSNESYTSARSTPTATLDPLIQKKVLSITFPIDQQPSIPHDGFTGYGIAMRRKFVSQLGIAPRTHCFFRYRLFIPADYNAYVGGKLWSLASIPEDKSVFGAQGMSSANVYNEYSWWAGIMSAGMPSGDSNLDHNRIQCYIYAKQIQGITFTQASVTGGQRGYNIKARAGLSQDPTAVNAGGSSVTGSGSYLYFTRNAWNTVEQEVVMNSDQRANGQYRLWLNGILAINIQNIKWAGDAYFSTANINMLMLDTFFGGPTSNTTAQGPLQYDDAILSTSYVGLRAA